MTTTQNPFADLTTFAYQSQSVASEALETWLGIAESVTKSAGSQTKNFRQIVHGMFDLIDQAFTVEREVAKYLTIASRVSATAADSFRELTDITLATVEAVATAAGRMH